MEILRFDDLPKGGFAGLKEKRFVMDQRAWGAHKNPSSWDGIGNFVYLADANFLPHGETGLHPHREIDVISVMVEGRIQHEGSLEHGAGLEAGVVQVQRAGAEGFRHNEINPDDKYNQMIQLWVAPDEQGEAAGYKSYKPQKGERIQVYGGSKEQQERFYSRTAMDVANLEPGQTVSQEGAVMAYLSKGNGTANGESLEARSLVRSDALEFTAAEESQLILIYADVADS